MTALAVELERPVQDDLVVVALDEAGTVDASLLHRPAASKAAVRFSEIRWAPESWPSACGTVEGPVYNRGGPLERVPVCRACERALRRRYRLSRAAEETLWLLAHGVETTSGIAAARGVTNPTASYVLGTLADRGLATVVAAGVYRLTDDGEAAVPESTPEPRTGEWWHGTPGGYSNRRCRCIACVRAKREWQRAYRRRRSEEAARRQERRRRRIA